MCVRVGLKINKKKFHLCQINRLAEMINEFHVLNLWHISNFFLQKFDFVAVWGMGIRKYEIKSKH